MFYAPAVTSKLKIHRAKRWQGRGGTRMLARCWWECRVAVPSKVGPHVHQHSPVSLPGTHPREVTAVVRTKTCTQTFTAGSFGTAQPLERPKCPSAGEQRKTNPETARQGNATQSQEE